MNSFINNNLHGQQDEQCNTNLKRRNRDDAIDHAGSNQKRARTNSVQLGSASSTWAAQGGVEAPGRNSRGQTRSSRNSNSKGKKGVRRGQNEKEPQVKQCAEVCEKMKDIMATKNLKVGDVVWAKAGRWHPAWPAVIIDPQMQAPEVVLNACVRGTICVMYYSFLAGEKRAYFHEKRTTVSRKSLIGGANFETLQEYGWVKPGMIFGFIANKKRFERQKVGNLKGRFRAAIIEATSPEKPMHSVTAEAVSFSSLEQRRPSKAQYDGCATVVPVDCVETQAGGVLDISSTDISGCDNVSSRDSLPEELPVFCKCLKGVYLPKEHLISCRCSSCMGKKMTPCTFEKHSGSLSKNWKRAVKIEKTMQLLKNWIDSNNDGPQIKQSNSQTTMRRKIDDVLQVTTTPIIVKWTIEKCAICWYCGDSESDKMIICNRCQVAAHQNCYGAQDVDDITSWVCRACENPQVNKDCCLCPIKGGALQKTDVGGFWVHVTCAQFQPEVSISMEPDIGIRNVPLETFGKTCVICQQTHGACTNCFMCSTYYHAMCALRSGYRMESHYLWRHGRKITQPRSYCSNHGDIDFGVESVEIGRKEGVSSAPELPSNRERLSTAYVETDLPSTSFEKGSCARCCIYQKGDKKRREEAVAHLVMGPRHHSLEDIEREIGTVPPSEQDPITFYEHVQDLKNKENICLGKSGIHGMGLFARRSIVEGELIIEYLGELIRPSVCEVREKRYQAEGKDCYFFQINDEVVIDATEKGNLARLINHSCQPNCFARILAMDTTRLVFVAKENISAGQELTLDYMFDVAMSEENRVPCLCNAPNCRRYMA